MRKGILAPALGRQASRDNHCMGLGEGIFRRLCGGSTNRSGLLMRVTTRERDCEPTGVVVRSAGLTGDDVGRSHLRTVPAVRDRHFPSLALLLFLGSNVLPPCRLTPIPITSTCWYLCSVLNHAVKRNATPLLLLGTNPPNDATMLQEATASGGCNGLGIFLNGREM